MRPPWFVPDIRPLSEQLKAFRRRKTPFAMVVDEYGEVMGVVTLEDILEEIVGDITDEHDIALPGVRPQPDGSVNVDGGVPIRDLNRAMDWTLPDGEATTIAGLVIHEVALDSGTRPELHLPRVPLPRAASPPQPHHRVAHHAACAQADGQIGVGSRLGNHGLLECSRTIQHGVRITHSHVRRSSRAVLCDANL